MLRVKNNFAQSTAEYVIVLGLIVAAVVAMQTYIKRGFQGRMKNAVDYVDMGGQTANVVQFSGGQYEPYYLSSSFASNRTANEEEGMSAPGVSNRASNEESTRVGNQVIGVTQ